MAWSSFAHLPNSEDEYYYILSNLKTGMTTKDVDDIIAVYKGKSAVQHHYRNNLARLGLFKVTKNIVTLYYDEKKLLNNRNLLKDILFELLVECKYPEIKSVIEAAIIANSYDLLPVISILEKKYPLINHNSFCRWVRPILTLLKITEILSTRSHTNHLNIKFLEESYFKITDEYNNSVPIELIELELKKIDKSLYIIEILDSILEIRNIRFKIELLMLPSWATKNKTYKVGKDYFTHIKIKSGLLMEDKIEKENNTK